MDKVQNAAHDSGEGVAHPLWCVGGAICRAAKGGPHLSETQLVPLRGPDERLLQLDLAQQPGAPSRVRLSIDGEELISIPTSTAFVVGILISDLGRIGRAER